MTEHDAGSGPDVVLPEGREITRLQVLSTIWSVVDHASGMQDDVPALWARCATDAEPLSLIHI